MTAVSALLIRYATALDSGRYEELRNVFTPDARADYGALGGVREGVDAIIGFCSRALGAFEAVQHHITNVVVADDERSARCYFLAVHVRGDGREPFVVGGSYADTLVATGAGPRIAQRVLVPTWQR